MGKKVSKKIKSKKTVRKKTTNELTPEKPLKINGSFLDVINISVKPKK